MANAGRFADEEVVFFPSKKKLPSQKAELFQVKAGLYSNGAFNQLPQSFATQAPTATAAPVVPGRLRRDDKGMFFVSRAGAWMDKVYPVYPDFFSLNLEVYELPFTINGNILQGKVCGNESHRARWVSILYMMLTNAHGE